MPRVVHFEINADKPERAAAFYKKTFGWKIKKWNGPMPYWMVTTGKKGEIGIDGGIMNRMKKATTVNTIAVPSLNTYLQKVKKAGGKQVMKEETIPGVGQFAYCTDTEGNVFGLLQPKAR
jgi:hypothetical protein